MDPVRIHDIAYTLAGKPSTDSLVRRLKTIDIKYLLAEEKNILATMLEVADVEHVFPSWQYLQTKYGNISGTDVIRNLGDLTHAINTLIDNRQLDVAKTELSTALMRSNKLSDLSSMTSDIMKSKKGAADKLNTIGSVKANYEFKENAPIGITSGIQGIDELTAGFQEGTVASIAGFTSHGKSTLVNNSIYLNALAGKKVGLVSLEIVKSLCLYIYLARHSMTMGKAIPYEKIIKGTLTPDEKAYLFDVVEPDFLARVVPNLVIAENEDVPSWDEYGILKLYEMFEDTLGGLDYVAWDHVNLFKYVGDGNRSGDYYINLIATTTKGYTPRSGKKPVTLFAVQVNREGWRRAKRNDGKYDLTALSDFNEIERSSTYVMFTYASEDMRDANRAKVQLMKHRLGGVQLIPDEIDVMYATAFVGNAYGKGFANVPTETKNAAMFSVFDSPITQTPSNHKFDDAPAEIIPKVANQSGDLQITERKAVNPPPALVVKQGDDYSIC